MSEKSLYLVATRPVRYAGRSERIIVHEHGTFEDARKAAWQYGDGAVLYRVSAKWKVDIPVGPKRLLECTELGVFDE